LHVPLSKVQASRAPLRQILPDSEIKPYLAAKSEPKTNSGYGYSSFCLTKRHRPRPAAKRSTPTHFFMGWHALTHGTIKETVFVAEKAA